MPLKKNILIVGCGRLGIRLAEYLSHSGQFQIWGVRRNISQLPKTIIPIQLDLTKRETTNVWPDEMHYVIYSAAAPSYSEQAYRDTYLTGLDFCLSQLLHQTKMPARVFLTSSTAVYNQNNGEWVNEESESHPDSFSGKIMLEAEAILNYSEFRATTIRFGELYGGNTNYLLNKVKDGFGYKESPVVYGNRIHIDDAAGMLYYLIKKDLLLQPPAKLYIGVDKEPCALYEVTSWLATQVHNCQINKYLNTHTRNSKRCSNKKIICEGYRFKYPNYRKGYQAILNHQFLKCHA